MPEFSLSERLENAHEEPIWAVTHVKDNIFATGSLDESVKLWWGRRLAYCCRYCPFCSRLAVNNSLIIALFRKCVPGAGGDGKVSLQLAHKLGGHSLGAVDITAFHNVASDVRIESIRLFINTAVTRPSGRHDSRVLSRF
jgi:hypothetical protein